MNNRFTKEMKKQFQKIRFLKSLLDNSTDSIQIEVCFESIFIYFDGINETLKNCQSLSKEVKEELHNKFNSEFENQIKICKNIKNTYHNVVDQKYIDNWSLIRNPSGNFYALLNFKKGKECLAKQKELESLLNKLKDKLAGKMTHSDKDNAFFSFSYHSSENNEIMTFPISVNFLVGYILTEYENWFMENISN